MAINAESMAAIAKSFQPKANKCIKHTVPASQTVPRSARVLALISFEDALRLNDTVESVPRAIGHRRRIIRKKSSLSQVLTAVPNPTPHAAPAPIDPFADSALCKNITKTHQILTFFVSEGLVSRSSIDLFKCGRSGVDSAASAIDQQVTALMGELGSNLPHAASQEDLAFLQNVASAVRYGDEVARRDFGVVLELATKTLDRVEEKAVGGALRVWVLKEFLLHGRE